jgi:hypothetical protein
MANRANKRRKNGKRSEAHGAVENLGNLKIEARRGDGPTKPSQKFPNIAAFAEVSYTKFFREMRENPLQVVDECQKAFLQFHTSIRRQLYELVALIYGFAVILREDESMRAGFLQKSFWKDRTYQKKNYLRMAFQFCLNTSQGEADYHRALTYARALSDFFRNDIPMEDIPALIEEANGIEKLAQLEKKRRKEAEGTQVADEEDEDELLDQPIGGVDDEPDDERRKQADDIFADLDDGNRPPSSNRSIALRPRNWDPRCDLVVSMKPAQLEEAMSSRRGQKLQLDLIVSDTGDWLTFKVQKMRWRS